MEKGQRETRSCLLRRRSLLYRRPETRCRFSAALAESRLRLAAGIRGERREGGGREKEWEGVEAGGNGFHSMCHFVAFCQTGRTNGCVCVRSRVRKVKKRKGKGGNHVRSLVFAPDGSLVTFGAEGRLQRRR